MGTVYGQVVGGVRPSYLTAVEAAAIAAAQAAANAAQADATTAIADAATAQGDATTAIADAATAQSDATTAIAGALAAIAVGNQALLDANMVAYLASRGDFTLPAATHPVTVAATLKVDAVDAEIQEFAFGSAAQSAVEMTLSVVIPSWATQFDIISIDRAETAPGVLRAVDRKLWCRPLPDDGSAVPAWPGAGTALASRAVAIGEDTWHTTTDASIALATVGLVAGQRGQIELSRTVGGGSDLAGNWLVQAIGIVFKP